MMNPLITLYATAFLGSLLTLSPVAQAAQDSPAPLTAEASLRGYGELKTRFSQGSDGSSVLELTCEDEPKAKLTQAKYLSDLGLLPGVRARTLSVDAQSFSVMEIKGQGLVAALRKGSYLSIVTAPSEEILKAALAALPAERREAATSTPEAEVPMWLDRWDRFGFRFYYRPWERPEGQTLQSYNALGEFRFAREMDRAGLVFWCGDPQVDTAEGIDNSPWNGWAMRAAEENGLPVGLNIFGETKGNGWFWNRFRDQTSYKMPQFTGGFHQIGDPQLGGAGILSWNATTAKDMELGLLQGRLRQLIQGPNVTSVLEPHGELRHGNHDIFLEYGPSSDAGFQRFLRERYGELKALNQAHGTGFQSWEAVRVPEVASFAGWGPDALDLTGEWAVGYEAYEAGLEITNQELRSKYKNQPVPTQPAPKEWFSRDFDDSGWPKVTAPGHDRTMFLPQRPAVYRRNVTIPESWLAGKKKVWLYLWDLNMGKGDVVRIAINGEAAGKSTVAFNFPHWGALEVGGRLKPGENQLTLRLPKGILAYRVYLSPVEPKQYPNLGKSLNRQWVDFVDFSEWSRVNMARRGMEMIRQVTPDHPITLMAPDYYVDGVKTLARRYGGNFHNTGYMGAFWADFLPSLMRGARLPMSLEPGGPARTLPAFKRQLGLYATEGLQGIDYFIHIGNILWNPEMKKHFEDNLREIKLLGKYNAPEAKVAALYSSRVSAYNGYPWQADLNGRLPSGYWNWNVRAYLRGFHESDGLTESSFREGDAARYQVVIDTNTSILDEGLLSEIEKYVRAGGTFVTFAQTGRHSPDEANAWPVSRLTGFRVTGMDPLDEDGNPVHTRSLSAAPGQELYPKEWQASDANGLTLEAVAPDAKPLLLWDDGKIAAGLRPLGKGFIIQLGCRFTGARMADRIEPPRAAMHPTFETRPAAARATTELLLPILAWRGIPEVAARWETPDENVLLRHFVSNNGLYDVWTVWNQSATQAIEGEIVLRNGVRPGWALRVRDETRINVHDGRIPVSLAPLETRNLLTPRGTLASAPLHWFELQRHWWRKTEPAPEKELPNHSNRLSLDLTGGWVWKELEESEDATPWIASEVDDSQWKPGAMGVFTQDKLAPRRVLLRRRFTVPESWTNGEPTLWLQSFWLSTFVKEGRVWLDGKLISDWNQSGPAGVNPEGVLRPGSQHTLAVEIRNTGAVVGSRGPVWLWNWVKPAERLDLAGEWSPSQDFLSYGEAIPVPGQFNAASLRRNILVPAEQAKRNAVLRVDSKAPVLGVLVNGTWIRRFHHIIGSRFDLNVTPFIRFGETNEIELVTLGGRPVKGAIDAVSLDFHEPDRYP